MYYHLIKQKSFNNEIYRHFLSRQIIKLNLIKILNNNGLFSSFIELIKKLTIETSKKD